MSLLTPMLLHIALSKSSDLFSRGHGISSTHKLIDISISGLSSDHIDWGFKWSTCLARILLDRAEWVSPSSTPVSDHYCWLYSLPACSACLSLIYSFSFLFLYICTYFLSITTLSVMFMHWMAWYIRSLNVVFRFYPL